MIKRYIITRRRRIHSEELPQHSHGHGAYLTTRTYHNIPMNTETYGGKAQTESESKGSDRISDQKAQTESESKGSNRIQVKKRRPNLNRKAQAQHMGEFLLYILLSVLLDVWDGTPYSHITRYQTEFDLKEPCNLPLRQQDKHTCLYRIVRTACQFTESILSAAAMMNRSGKRAAALPSR